MTNNLIGRFHFKLTDSQNLIGEFSNNGCERNYTESADRIATDAAAGKFAGDYLTTWCDEENGKLEAVLANLKIEPKKGCKNIFSLTWIIQDGKNMGISFWGEGMQYDGMLIGDYRNFEKI